MFICRLPSPVTQTTGLPGCATAIPVAAGRQKPHRRRVWICDKTLPFFNLKGLAACHPGSSHTDHEILIFLHGFGEFFIESIDICAALFLCLIMFLCYDRYFSLQRKALVSPVLSLKQRMSLSAPRFFASVRSPRISSPASPTTGRLTWRLGFFNSFSSISFRIV